MLETLSSLMSNAGSVIAVGYLLSLTYTDWRPDQSLHKKLFRSLIASAAAFLLMFQPFHIGPEITVDLRLVPLSMVALRYGIRYGILAALPVLLVQWMMGEQAVTFSVLIAMLTVFGVLGLHKALMHGKVALTRTYLQLPLVMFSLSSLSALYRYPAEVFLQEVFPWSFLIHVLSFWASSAIVRSRMKYLKATEFLKQASFTDPLTMLLNRRQFEHDQSQFSPGDVFLMLDIDRFKSINDTHGHAAGDQVLKHFAELLRRATRDYDLLYRLGGEEFLVVLRRIDAHHAYQTAERIRESVQGHVFPISRAVTVSGGLKVLSEPVNVPQLLEQVDELLYSAKAAGRNQVMAEIDFVLTLDKPSC